jgi:hypothetical protein
MEPQFMILGHSAGVAAAIAANVAVYPSAASATSTHNLDDKATEPAKATAHALPKKQVAVQDIDRNVLKALLVR